MKHQIVVIHGGNCCKTEKAYLRFLKKKDVDLDKICGIRKDWKNSLQKELGKKYEIILPNMPNAYNANYLEWKIWFEKSIPYLHSGVVLVGHSLGGIFLVKYLSENKFPKNITALLLVATPYNDGELGNFRLRINVSRFSNLARQAKQILLYHSKDDPVVPFAELLVYQKFFKKALSRVFENYGHFNQKKFPELIKDIKNVFKK